MLDRLLYNGIISSLDEKRNVYDAIGIKDGKIAFLGSNKEATVVDTLEKVDLKGRLLLPGFTDSHMHLLNYSFIESAVKLFDAKSLEEALELAKSRYKMDKEHLTFLYCRGWNEDKFDTRAYPHRSQLDEISQDIPIVMVRVCGHIGVSNSIGLERLKQLPEFEEFKAEVDFESGLIRENAMQYYFATLNSPSQEDIQEMITFGIKELHKAGITSVQSDDLSSLPGKNRHLTLKAFKSLGESGKLQINYYEQCLFERVRELEEFLDKGYRTGQSYGNFTIGPIKILEDGALGAKTAALNSPYEGEPDNRGVVTFSQDELDKIVSLCDENHMQLAAHTIGDRAMDMVIEAIEKSPSRSTNPKGRHGLVHVQIANRAIIDKMAKNNLLAYIQPVFVDYDMDIAESRIGKARMDGIYPWKSLIDKGVCLCGSSDAPVVSFNVLENIYYAVTRSKLDGSPEGGWLPDEKLTIDEALDIFIKTPHIASFTESINGTLELGKYADLVILSKNLYEIPTKQIKNVKVLETIFRGKTVYKA